MSFHKLPFNNQVAKYLVPSKYQPLIKSYYSTRHTIHTETGLFPLYRNKTASVGHKLFDNLHQLVRRVRGGRKGAAPNGMWWAEADNLCFILKPRPLICAVLHPNNHTQLTKLRMIQHKPTHTLQTFSLSGHTVLLVKESHRMRLI